MHKDCDGSQGWFKLTEVDGERIGCCPLTLVTDDTHRMMAMHTYYKNGYLPVAGGMLDQTEIFVRAMEVIESAINENEKAEAEKRNR